MKRIRWLPGADLPPKTVVLTYDDGPDEHTLDIARFLHERGIVATFFVNGRRFCETVSRDGSCAKPASAFACKGRGQTPAANPPLFSETILDELIRLGHDVGNHSQNHCDLSALENRPAIASELALTSQLIARHQTQRPIWFRPPYGRWSSEWGSNYLQSEALSHLVGPVLWDVDGSDWECWRSGISVPDCGARYVSALSRRAEGSGIFLLHDRSEFNVGSDAALRLTEWIVTQLASQGYEFSSLARAFPRGIRMTSAIEGPT